MVKQNDLDSIASNPKDDWRNRLDDDSFEYQVRDFWESYGKKVKTGIIATVMGITALGGFYTVPNDSKGVITTFGKYTATTNPGLRFKVPFVQKVTKIEDQAVFTESFGFRTVKPGVKSEYIGVSEILAGKAEDSDLKDIVEGEGLSTDGDLQKTAASILRGEYLMLSGDLSMADVEWVVQYRKRDPVAYLFNVRDPRKVLRDASESMTRIVVGDASIDEILTTGRSDIEIATKVKLQEKLRQYNSGMEIVLVQLQSSNPPESVRPSFNEVNKSLQAKSQKINNAMEQYNKEIPKARGDSAAMIQQAEGYASQRVNNALGDVARFEQIYAQYKNAPSVTRTRMYLETMPTVLGSAKNIYYIEDNGGLLLKKLDLNTVDGGAK